MENYEQQNQPSYLPPSNSLPNATAVLVLGILSIVLTCCYGAGLICGIIGLVLSAKDLRLYKESPELYTPGSYSNLKAGRVCSIIGVAIASLYIIFLIIMLITVGFSGMSDWRHYRNY